MTIQIDLPKDVEDRLRAEVSSGRHATVADAILEKVSRGEEPDLMDIIRQDRSWVRRDLDAAWLSRDGAGEGEAFFKRLGDQSASPGASEK
jgi:Arc/MetJ-type ribon-helix-helix transcriptional regulator